jgi:peptidoglycan/LPS O-acetylase OafA/YrhL/lysophospholipase L1-like esterase
MASVALATPVAAAPAVTRDRTAAAGRSVQLEAIRGAAALMVVCVHAGFLSQAETLFSAQDSGLHLLLRRSLTDSVVVFFALSGYLVGGPFLRALLAGTPPADPVVYAVRRVARILPGYWFALAAMLAVLATGAGFSLWQVPVHALLLQNLVPGPESTLLLGVAWTLGIEALYYVVMPVGTAVVRRAHRGPVRAGSLIAAVAVIWILAAGLGLAVDLRMSTSPWWFPINLNLPFCICLFCPGMIVSVLEVSPPRETRVLGRAARWVARHPVTIAIPALLALLVSARLMEEPQEWVNRLHYQFAAMGAGLLVAFALRARIAHRLAVRVLAAGGKVSYGIYVWHWVVLQTLIRLSIRPSRGLAWSTWAVDGALLVSLTMPLAIASWFMVEKPWQSFAKRWTARYLERKLARPAPVVALRPASARSGLRTRLVGAIVVGSVAGAVSALSINHGAATNAFAKVVAPQTPQTASQTQAQPMVTGHLAQSRPTPAPDARPIVAFGDSLTESWGVPEANSYPVIMGGLLGQKVIAAGFEGKTTAQAIDLLPQALADNPRLMVVQFGTNDACLGVPMATALANLDTILGTLDARHIESVIVGTHFDSTRHGHSPICARWVPYSQNWDAGLTALAQRHHSGLVLDVLEGTAAQPDGYHPDAAGYATMAERVAVAVRAVEMAARPSL